MQIIGIDPAYRKIGAFRVSTHPSYPNITHDLEAYLFVNEYDSNYEDKFLYKLSQNLRRHLTIHENFFLVIEYTPVPRFKSVPSINRVIGVIYATLHPFLTGFYELNMNTIYSHFNIKGKYDKKKKLYEKLLSTLPDLIFYKEINLIEEKVYAKKLKKEELPQDCLDAYALINYIRQFEKKQI
jgi:hypothetical protein